jgi:hypothetical protein
MKIKLVGRSNHPQFDFPAPLYYLAKLLKRYPVVANFLHDVETAYLRNRIEDLQVHSPVYITGLARAGTTVVLDMLTQHPALAAHRYLHMVLPYLPHWFREFAEMTPIMTSPVERLHKDRLLVTRDSPEAVEEQFWQSHFTDVLNESVSSILDSTTSDRRFEQFYRENIKKLMYNQNATRYVAKNNYNVTRLEYILKLFPGAKFIIMARNPFDHIASLAKQDVVLGRLETDDPKLLDWTKIIGHREFGSGKVCINVGDSELIQQIRRLWSKRETYVEGWARYWTSIYSYVLDKLSSNHEVANASLLVRYEDLCGSPAKTIDAITKHLGLNREEFTEVRKLYIDKLRQPSYYRTMYTEDEQETIIRISSQVTDRLGYHLGRESVVLKTAA